MITIIKIVLKYFNAGYLKISLKPLWLLFFLWEQLRIIGRGWAKYRDLSGRAEQIVNCGTLKNNDILRWPSSTTLFSFLNHSLKAWHFSQEILATNPHEQNIICCKTHLDVSWPCFLRSRLKIMWLVFSQWKERKIARNVIFPVSHRS